MEGHLAALVNVSNDAETGPLYYFLGGDAAHHINLINYDDPAPIGVFKASQNELSSAKETDPDSLQSMDVDLREFTTILANQLPTSSLVHPDSFRSILLGMGTEVSKKTLALMARQDHEEHINVILAHDQSMEAVLAEISGNKDTDFIRLRGTKEEHKLIKNRKRKEKGEA